MKTVHTYLQGGLGNQCFIYAAARALALRRQAKMSIGCDYLLEDRVYKRKLALDSFNCIYDVIPPRPKLIRLAQKMRYHLLRDYFGRIGNYCADKRPFCFRPLPLDWHGKMTLDGYWQSEKYFYDAREELVADFRLKNDSWLREDPSAQQISRVASKSAFIHVRSYKEVPGKEDGSCAKAMAGFYTRAIRHLQERVSGLRIFLFSDDIAFARDLLKTDLSGRTPIIIPAFSRDSSVSDQIRDFTLMRMCCHGIVADSSFSWWAGWLGEQEWARRGESPIRIHVNRRVLNDDFWPERWLAI